jgi:hypothetical protein
MLTGRLSSSRVPSKHAGETNTLLEDSRGPDSHAEASASASPSASDSAQQDSSRGLGLGREVESTNDDETSKRVRKLVRRMRIQIWAGTISGFIIALAIGAAFIAVVSAMRGLVHVTAPNAPLPLPDSASARHRRHPSLLYLSCLPYPSVPARSRITVLHQAR